MTQCTAANMCQDLSYCSRQSNATACPTSGSCTGAGCGPAVVGNVQTCFMCGDTCSSTMAANTCNGIAACTWAPICIPVAAAPCTATTQAGCVADASGCFWVAATTNLCGVSSSVSACSACNNTGMGIPTTLIGPLSRMVGQTCTWPAVSPYVKPYMITLNAFQQAPAGTGGCVAIPTGTPQTDMATITGFAMASSMMGGTMSAFAATSVGTCAKASSPASMLSPSLAILGLVAFLTRL